MHNLLAPSSNTAKTPSPSGTNRPLTQLQSRLDALLMVLKSCKATQCTLPWNMLHPKGGVSNLLDALNPKYDSFYAAQPKVGFEKCELGYIIASEGPQTPKYYLGGGKYGDWS